MLLIVHFLPADSSLFARHMQVGVQKYAFRLKPAIGWWHPPRFPDTTKDPRKPEMASFGVEVMQAHTAMCMPCT